jgi:mannose-6-phosphate isomerase-like protein (cupin superfamily)
MSAMQQRSFESRIAKPAAWRLALAPPPEPAARPTRSHERLITAGVPDGLEGAAVVALDGSARGPWERLAVHEHEVAELNVLLPVAGLTCEVVLGDERYDVEAPASIVVPAGLRHSINVTAGAGYLVTVALSSR